MSINPHCARFIGTLVAVDIIVRAPRSRTALTLRRVRRVLAGNASRLTRAEKAALTPFTATSTTTKKGDEEEEKGSFVEHLQKRRALLQRKRSTTCCTVAHPTFGQERHGLLPMTLEMILFLRETGTYWDAQTVDEATRS
ncbi:hypothetical protein GQ600_25343 [Phytophthora cactorum]|nr:hypothetical protein GQ600_25343 [Phytophthora cactorum]